MVWTLKPPCAVDGLAGGSELQQIEYRLDVGVEPVVSLAGKRDVAIFELGDRLRRVEIQLRSRRRRRPWPAARRRRSGCTSAWRCPGCWAGRCPCPSSVVRPGALVDLVDGVALDQILRASPTLPITPRYDCRMVLRFRNVVANLKLVRVRRVGPSRRRRRSRHGFRRARRRRSCTCSGPMPGSSCG